MRPAWRPWASLVFDDFKPPRRPRSPVDAPPRNCSLPNAATAADLSNDAPKKDGRPDSSPRRCGLQGPTAGRRAAVYPCYLTSQVPLLLVPCSFNWGGAARQVARLTVGGRRQTAVQVYGLFVAQPTSQ
eukprot:GHVT01004934.1.p4 GENE.GHVT01004934.1~~GHVT01004934.1.p4  ORF type:complete len:129 (-),score=26.60 GHVT01004934.1:1480-1866(-)